MIAICTFKTKLGYKKFITFIGSNKLISAKNSESHLTFKTEMPLDRSILWWGFIEFLLNNFSVWNDLEMIPK